jgi:hypothetical protein
VAAHGQSPPPLDRSIMPSSLDYAAVTTRTDAGGLAVIAPQPQQAPAEWRQPIAPSCNWRSAGERVVPVAADTTVSAHRQSSGAAPPLRVGWQESVEPAQECTWKVAAIAATDDQASRPIHP